MATHPEVNGPAGVERAVFRVRSLDCHAIDTTTREAWACLEARAVEANAYLSPHFVLPAVRHLESGPPPVVLLAETEGGELGGVGVFAPRPPDLRFPLPHLVAYRSRHSYLSGLLVDQRHVTPVVSAFFDFFCAPHQRWHGIAFTGRSAEGPLATALSAVASARGVTWQEMPRTQRAMLVPSQAGEGYLEEALTNGRLKGLRRKMRRLREMGNVDWRLLGSSDVSAGTVDRFLALEHLGWKGAEGTSLRSKPEDEAFFREAVEGFRGDGRVWFTELSLDGVAISSTSNFVSGRAGFAFKIGWDPACSKVSPGMLNEIELIRHAPALLGDLDYVDSGAAEGSFLDDFWTGRRALVSGIYATTAMGRRALALVGAARHLKHRLRRSR